MDATIQISRDTARSMVFMLQQAASWISPSEPDEEDEAQSIRENLHAMSKHLRDALDTQ